VTSPSTCPCACRPLALTALEPVPAVASPEVAKLFLPDLVSPAESNAGAEPRRTVSLDQLSRSLFAHVPVVDEESVLTELCMTRLKRDGAAAPAASSIASKDVHVYDLKRGTIEGTGAEALLVLYSRYPPQNMNGGPLMAEWRVALLDADYDVLADAFFMTRIPYVATWDTTDTALRLENGRVVAHVVYAQACLAAKTAQSFSVPIGVSLAPACVVPGIVTHAGSLGS